MFDMRFPLWATSVFPLSAVDTGHVLSPCGQRACCSPCERRTQSLQRLRLGRHTPSCHSPSEAAPLFPMLHGLAAIRQGGGMKFLAGAHYIAPRYFITDLCEVMHHIPKPASARVSPTPRS
ncbi:Squalene synthase 1 [Zea mays]|uniref:Squalene synthase 1 n=1 Tax=Zea mays TaxID=4577 RepID=A0A1D6L8B3_MAIZE|nr:Squalene synthase 1 [Zea mays]